MIVKVKTYVKPSEAGEWDIAFLERCWHRNCAGRIELRKNWTGTPEKRTYGCKRCGREFFIAKLTWQTDADKHFRLTKYNNIDTSTLEPAFKLIDKAEGPTAFTTVRPMTSEELLKYHGYKNYEIVEADPKPVEKKRNKLDKFLNP